MPKILDRLIKQLKAKGKSDTAANAIARASLQRNGVLKGGSEELTTKGKKRNNMTASERAKDRAAKYSKNKNDKPSDYKYNQLTNIARKRKKNK